MAENTEQVRIQVSLQGAEEASAALRRLGDSVNRINSKFNGAAAGSAGYATSMANIESSTRRASKAAEQLGGILGTLGGQLRLAAAITFTQAIGAQLAGALGVVRSGILTFNAVLETAQVGLGTLIRNRAELDAYVASNIEIARTSANAADAERIRAEMAKKYAVSQQEANYMAQQQVELLRQFANVTPFYFTGLTKTAVMMQAFGFRMEEILTKDTMGRFQGAIVAIGDAVAALGGSDETIQRIAYALGQMRSAGRVYQNDMMQLANAGIAGYQILGKALMDDLEAAGQTSSQLYKDLVNNPVEVIRDLAKRGKLSGEAAAEAILAGLNERYGGGMKRFQKTFAASLTTLSDTTQSLVAVAFKPLFYTVRDGMVNLALELQKPAVMDAAKRFNELIYGMAQVIKLIAPVISNLAIAIGDKLNNAIVNLNFDSMMGRGNALLSFFGTLKRALETLADFLGSKFGQSFVIAAGGLMTFMKFLAANPAINFIVGLAAALGILRQAFDENTYGIRDLFGPLIDDIVNGGKQAAEQLSVLAKAFLEAFSGTLVNAIQTFAQVFGGILDVLKSIASIISPNVDSMKALGNIIGTLAALLVLKKIVFDGFTASLVRMTAAASALGASRGAGMFAGLNNYFNFAQPGAPGPMMVAQKMNPKTFMKLPANEQARVASLASSYAKLNGSLGKAISLVGGLGTGFMMLGVAVGMVNPQLGGLITILGTLMMVVPAVAQAIVALRAAMAAAQGSMMAFLATPAGMALVAIAALTAGVFVLMSSMRENTEVLRNQNEQVENLYIGANKLSTAYGQLSETAEHVFFPSGTDFMSTSEVQAYNDKVDQYNATLGETEKKLEHIKYWYTQDTREQGIWSNQASAGIQAYNADLKVALDGLRAMSSELQVITTLSEKLHVDVEQFSRLQNLQKLMSATGLNPDEIVRSSVYDIAKAVKDAFPEYSTEQVWDMAQSIDALNDSLTADERAWLQAATAVDPYIAALEKATGLTGQMALDYVNLVTELKTKLAELIAENTADEAQADYERKLKLLTSALDNAQDAADAAMNAFKRAFDQFKFFYDQLVQRLSMVFQDKLQAQVDDLKAAAEEAIRAIQVMNLGEMTTVGYLRDQVALMKEMIDDRERLKALQEAQVSLQRAELGLYDASKDPFEAAIAMREAAQAKSKAQEQFTIATMEDTLQGAQAQIDDIQAKYDTLLQQLKNDQAMLQNQFQSYFSDYLDFIQAIADGELTLKQANKKFLERYGVENVFGSTKADKALGWDNFLAGAKGLFGVDLGDLKMPEPLTNFGKNFGENFKTAATNLAKWLRDKWPALMKKALTAASTQIAVTKAEAALTALTPPAPQKVGPAEMDTMLQMQMVDGWNTALQGMQKELTSKLTKAGKGVYASYFNSEIGKLVASSLQRAYGLIKTTPVDASAFTTKILNIYEPVQARIRSLFARLNGTAPSPGTMVPRAAGGLIQKGGQYLVGERGPELFVSNNRGMILPNSVTQALLGATGGGYGGGSVVNIYNPVVRDDRDIRKMAEKVSAAQNKVLRAYGRR